MSDPCGSCLSSLERTVLEETTFEYAGVLTNEKELPVPDTDLDSLTLTLYDKKTGVIINSRDNQDILNTNDGTVDASGNFTWQASPEDNDIIDDTLLDGQLEEHVALFTWKYNSGVSTGRHQLSIFVQQLTKVSDIGTGT